MAIELTTINLDFLSDGRAFERLLQQKAIKRFCLIMIIALYISSFALLALVAQEVVSQSLTTATAEENLKNQVAMKVSKLTLEKADLTTQRDYNKIAEDAIFGKIGRDEPPAPIVVPEKKVAPVKTVPLVLIGTFVDDSDPDASYAIIANEKTKAEDVFSLDDDVFESGYLSAVFGTKVEIDKNGTIETLLLDDTPDSVAGSGSSSPASDTHVVDESELNNALDNLPLLLTQARAVPYFKDGQSVGLRLFAIKRDSLYEKIGLKNGDILKDINGENLGDITQAVKLFEKLKDERSITLTLERSRVEKVINYQIR